ncbi:MAG TPA: hypothetical protein VGQ39_04935 [Pyrinomonadaceae bacterium]|jgi:hypothetical protein|nr:hypothetical protein [Pyrinomonadaceae bacterium]
MSFDVTDAERAFLLELLDARHTSMLHELHHTDTYEYRELLQQKVSLLEQLQRKLKNIPAKPTTIAE